MIQLKNGFCRFIEQLGERPRVYWNEGFLNAINILGLFKEGGILKTRPNLKTRKFSQMQKNCPFRNSKKFDIVTKSQKNYL